MLKKLTWATVLACFMATPLMADPLPDASVDVSLDFVSNYVWRGTDLHGDSVAQQKGLKQDGKIVAPAFQPSITFNTPVEGLSFNIWGSFATDYRGDQDTDQILQQGPGGAALTLDEAIASVRAVSSASLTGTATGTHPVDLRTPDCKAATTCLPGYYEEENGLERLDEIDYTIDYTRETNIGTMGFGIVYYTQPNLKYKGGAAIEEVYFTYALPGLSELAVTVYTDISNNSQYINLGYDGEFTANDTLTVIYGASTGYGIKENLQGVQNVDGYVGVDVSGFFVKAHITHRPDLRFHDTDTSVGSDSLPMFAVGSSSRADGLVTDRSQTYGPVDAYVNSLFQTALTASSGGAYTYTPRQKLPSELYWVSLGYAFSI